MTGKPAATVPDVSDVLTCRPSAVAIHQTAGLPNVRRGTESAVRETRLQPPLIRGPPYRNPRARA